MNPDTCVALFARIPERGAVKTRLAAAIGGDAALAVHCELLRWTLERIVPGQGYRLELWLAGDVDRFDMDHGAARVRRQCAGDLGVRMLDAIRVITRRGQRAIVIGSDCPLMSGDYLRAAIAALQSCDVVLGPSEDGGYALIGMCRPVPELFEAMTWGVATVCAETRHRARALGLSVIELETVWDVDTVADWRRWCALRP